MIVQGLVDLYERLRDDPDPTRRPAEPGWQEKEIAFVVDLAPDGRPLRVLDLRQPQAKGRPRAAVRTVPQEVKRTVKELANLLWDNPEYALGVPDPALAAESWPEAKLRARRRRDLFALRLRLLGDVASADLGVLALSRFLAADPLAAIRPVIDDATALALCMKEGNVAFRLDGDLDLICRRPAVRAAIAAAATEEGDAATGQCLVTGATGPVARLHPAIKGIAGAQAMGANIVSFNLPAFESYGLTQGSNAPIGAYAAFAYTTALNWLLARDSRHRTRAAATTVVFWAGRATPNEAPVCALMSSLAEDDPSKEIGTVERLYAAPATGQLPAVDDPTPFLILGLSAESRSRLTVRFFHQGTIAGAAAAIVSWRHALAIVPEDGPPPSMRRLLRGLAVQGEIDNAPPLLEAELLRAAFTGGPLPERLLAEALNRCAAESGPTRERAALIKAFLVRNHQREITVALDPEAPDPAYRLGRLFAVLEWIQERAVGAKAGIADRYWGAATTTPAFVFPTLLQLSVHHLGKLDATMPGFATNRRKDIERITAGLPAKLPARLALVDQGSFAIGYWQQRADRRKAAEPGPDTTDATDPQPALDLGDAA
jgi:CRISPR-associated protein Csd1